METQSELFEAFKAGFLASNDCGYDGACYVADPDKVREGDVTDEDLRTDFEEWQQSRGQR